jgi:hypothetical protein
MEGGDAMLDAKKYLKAFFRELYEKKDVSCLDRYLHPEYFDCDIGPGTKDHVGASKDFVLKKYTEDPGFRVNVKEVRKLGRAYCARLVWSTREDGAEKILFEGIATFLIEGGKIRRRGTFLFA